MNKCLTHNQEYPTGSWCVYCGRPALPETNPVYPTPPATWSRCPMCGAYYQGAHACWTYNPNYPGIIC